MKLLVGPIDPGFRLCQGVLRFLGLKLPVFQLLPYFIQGSLFLCNQFILDRFIAFKLKQLLGYLTAPHNSEVSGAVNQAVGEALTYYLEEHPKEAKQIVDKVILAATARIAARKARESVQRKSPMGGGGLPGKLADCSSRNPLCGEGTGAVQTASR